MGVGLPVYFSKRSQHAPAKPRPQSLILRVDRVVPRSTGRSMMRKVYGSAKSLNCVGGPKLHQRNQRPRRQRRKVRCIVPYLIYYRGLWSIRLNSDDCHSCLSRADFLRSAKPHRHKPHYYNWLNLPFSSDLLHTPSPIYQAWRDNSTTPLTRRSAPIDHNRASFP